MQDVLRRLDALEREVALLRKEVKRPGNGSPAQQPARRQEPMNYVQVVVFNNFNDGFTGSLQAAMNQIGCNARLKAVSMDKARPARHVILAFQVSGRMENIFARGKTLKALRGRVGADTQVTAVGMNIGLYAEKLSAKFPMGPGTGEEEVVDLVTLWTPTTGMMAGGAPTFTVDKNGPEITRLCRILRE